MLTLLSQFAAMFGMVVNIDKTKWMEFRPPRTPATSLTFTYAGHILQRVDHFKYMGVWWDSSDPLSSSHIPHATILGTKALSTMLAKCRSLGINRPDQRSRLFQALVRGAFSHGCQVWSVDLFLSGLKKPTSCSLAGLQMHFLRSLAGVGRHAHHLSLLHEFRHRPVLFDYIKLAARFWNKALGADSNSLLHRAMLSDLHLCFDDGWGRCKSCWCYQFLLTMHKLGTLPIPPQQLDIPTVSAMCFPEDEVTCALHNLATSFCSFPSPLTACPRTYEGPHVLGFTYRYWIGMTPASPGAPHLSHSPLRATSMSYPLSSLL